MANEGAGGQERTEQPTPRRREEAKREGRIARSTELSAAIVLLAGASVLGVGAGGRLAGFAQRTFEETGRAMAFTDLGPGGLAGIARATGAGLLEALVPFLAGVMGLTAFINLLQAKGVLSLHPIRPDFSKVDPAKGTKRLFGGESLFTALKAVLKLAAISLVTWLILARTLPDLLMLSETGAAAVMRTMTMLLVRLAVFMGIAYLALSVVDYAWQRHRMEKQLRMTRQEVVYEHKDSEGNPLVKGRLAALARAFARRRMLQEVPEADVVVTNPTHIAVALKYDLDAALAPVVVAMGQRKLAERIKALARRANVPLVENKPVARALLATGKVGHPIPPALYAAVAEILAFVYRTRGAGTRYGAAAATGGRP